MTDYNLSSKPFGNRDSIVANHGINPWVKDVAWTQTVG